MCQKHLFCCYFAQNPFSCKLLHNQNKGLVWLKFVLFCKLRQYNYFMKKNNLRWTVKIFVLSICLSILFSIISQSLFPTLPAVLSILVIVFFIVLSTVFDMIGVAVASANLDKIKKIDCNGCYETAKKLCKNTEKVSSFCCDVVGDICGILSGAGGVSLVLNLNLQQENLYFVATCLASSITAGLTIFAKAIMKRRAVDNAEKILISTSKCFDLVLSPKELFSKLKKKISKNK